MKALKAVLLIVVLLSVLIVAGCQEEYSSSHTTGGFAWERSATGYWQPNVAHRYSSNAEYELSQR